MVKNSKFFANYLAHPIETLWPTYTRMCAGLCPTHWTTYGNAEKNRNGSCLQHEWDPHFFEFLTPPCPRPQGPMDPTGRGGTSADIVHTQIKFGGDPCKCCWDIAQKPPKCKNSPLTPIVTKISLPLFSVRRGTLTPKRGEDTSGTRLRHANFGVNRPTGCQEIVDRTKKHKKHTVKQILRPSL